MQCAQLCSSVTLLVCSLLTLLTLVPAAANAQGVDAALPRVVVTDPSGAVVPKAQVTMINEGAGVATVRTTDDRGLCIFGVLQPAPYAAKVEAKGFKTAGRQHIVLQVGRQGDIVFLLELGAQTETTVVSGRSA